MIFNGQYDEEIFNEYGKWHYWIANIFLPIIDTENGDFRCFPYEGGILEQGYITMEILYFIQNVFRKIQYDKMKQIKK